MRLILFSLLLCLSLSLVGQEEKRTTKYVIGVEAGYSMSGITSGIVPGVLFKNAHQINLGYVINHTYSSNFGIFHGYKLGYKWWNQSKKAEKLFFGFGPSLRHAFGSSSSYLEANLDMSLKVKMYKGLFFRSDIGVGGFFVISNEVQRRLNGNVTIGLLYEI